MVLLGVFNINQAYGPSRGPLLYDSNNKSFAAVIIGNIFFDLCKDCLVMASIPPSSFSACRIRESQREMKMSNIKTGGNNDFKFFNTSIRELSPMKYNSKLMNSIWGIYNRYSPHNVKKVNDAHFQRGELQQSAVNSPLKTGPAFTASSSKLDVIWATI